MKVYLIENITDPKWMFLLDWVYTKAHYFVIAKDPDKVRTSFFRKEKIYPKKLDQIKSSLVDEYDSKERWHTRQIFSTHFYRYKLDDKVWKYIKSKPSLNMWLSPEPEDPSFYDKTKNPILETISHELYAFIFPQKDDFEVFKSNGIELLEVKIKID